MPLQTEDPPSIDPVMIMRIPTMISGIVLALTLLAQLPHYTNVATREWFVGGLGLLVVIANMVLIFFAAVHCPAHMVIDGAVVSNDCSTWY
mmetsp:Transcript_39597/g.93802  ORF Transcript_39597/g.93802 Transcript_39597/m.93802 type:complete len:91 (+) Transcript_39597:246-518(+)